MPNTRPRPALLMWLRPGVDLKRWLLLAGAALVLASLGLGLILADLYRVQPFPELAYYLTLQFIPRLPRGLLLLLLGLGCGAFAAYRFSRSLLAALLPGASGPTIQTALRRRYLQSGPRVVAIGGGTGLSTLLRGLKEITTNVTAIVTVADAEPLMARLLEHRFRGEGELRGHSFGNLFLTALAEITGSFDRAVEESSRVLAVRGRVIPATLADVTLGAELAGGRLIRGESAIGHAGAPIKRVFLDPANVPAYPEAIRALLEADVIIVGPGSLYTSILPNLLVRDVARALRASRARKVYVCNVATEPGETTGFAAADFVRVLEEHLGEGIVDCILVNDRLQLAGPSSSADAAQLVTLGQASAWVGRMRLLAADLIDEARPTRHDPHKLASALLRLALT